MANILLIDAPGLVCRAFYAIPPLSTNSGIPTNAVYGFTKSLIGLTQQPEVTHVGVCFDLRGRLGRQELYPEYKANRDSATVDLSTQIEICLTMATTLGLKCVRHYGWEADDVIGTLTRLALEAGHTVEIVTSDKDFHQLLKPGVTIWDPGKKIRIIHEHIPAKYGVLADQLLDYQTLIGDAIDNVPNVPGIGPKTAVKLLTEFGTIDNMMVNTARIESSKLRSIVEASVERLKLIRSLVSFRCDLPLEVGVDDLARVPVVKKDLDDLLEALDFSRRIGSLLQ